MLPVLLVIQSAAALACAGGALLQGRVSLPPPLDGAGTAGRWGSFAVYLFCALATLVLLRPRVQRAVGAFVPAAAREALAGLWLGAGLLGWGVLVFHLLAGNVWLSARVTPFTHADPVPYLMGGLAASTSAFALLALGQALLEFALRRRRSLLLWERRMALLLGAVVLLGSFAEVGWRLQAVAWPQTDGLGVTPGTSMWLRRYTRQNGLGFRDEELEPKARGEYRVAVLGDSLIYGYGVNDPESRATEVLCHLLEERLSEPRRVRVLNIALPGAGTERELSWLREVALPAKPDLVVLGHFWNDIKDAQRGSPSRGAGAAAEGPGEPAGVDGAEAAPGRQLSRRRVARIWLQSQSAIGAQLLRLRLLLAYGRTKPGKELLDAYASPEVYARHLESLQSMSSACAEAGVPFVIVLLPDFAFPFAESPYGAVAAALERDLRGRGIPTFDLVRLNPPPFSGGRDLWANANDSHPNALAHAWIAEGMRQAIFELEAGRTRTDG